MTVPLDAPDYLAGLAFLTGTAGSAAAFAALVLRRRLDGIRGAPRTLAWALLFTAGLIAAHLLPGSLGILSRTSALVCAGLLAALAVALPRCPAWPEPAGRAPPPSPRSSWVVAAAGVLVVAAGTLAAAWTGSGSASTDIDSLTFHLPNVARWMQTGSLWQVDNFTPMLANGNYPHNGDVIHLAVVQPFRTDAFSRLVNVPFAALAGLAVYALAIETGAARAASVLVGAVFASLPAFVFATGEGAKTDPVMLASFGAGVLFLVRHFRTGARSDLLLAGLGLGLAFGTKWYGVTSVVAVLVVWAGVWLWARRPAGALARHAGVLTAVIGATGGFWLLRNLVESGNPVFPTRIAPGGATVFDAPRDFIRECGGFTILGYLDAPRIWKAFILPDFRDNFGLPGVLLLLGFLLAVLLLLRRGRPPHARSRAAPLLLAGAVAALALAYSATPYSAFGLENAPELVGANTRWLLPSLMVASALLAWVAGPPGRRRRVVELLALVAIADGARRGFAESLDRVVLAALVVVAAAVLSAGLWRLIERGRVRPAPAAVVLGAFVLLLVGFTGYSRQTKFHDGRYAEGDPVISWFAQHPEQRKVGLAGVWSTAGLSPVLPAFGPRLANKVSFVGRYERGQLREIEGRAAFLAAVRGGAYDLLVVGKGGYGSCRVPGRESDERAWASSAGFLRLAESDRLVLFRVRSRSSARD